MRDLLGIMVAVNLVTEAGKELVEIRVEPYPSPISYKGEYHYRSGSTKQVLKGAALQRFLMRRQGRHWDDAPVPGFDVADCSQDAFRLFRTRATESRRVGEEALRDENESLLENLQLRDGQYFKRAATLLFSENPERHVSGAYVKIGFFVTDDDLRYQDEIHGNLFVQAEKTLDLMFSKYLKAYISYEGLQRLEKFLFPYPAVREALLNAVVHKDYSSGIPIQISVYDDKIVLWNSGQLPQDWTLERLLGKHPSAPYNPLIAGAFFRAGYIEAWGRGIEKINRECREHGIDPPLYDSSMSGLMVTFRANPQHLVAALGEAEAKRISRGGVGERVGERVGEKLTPNQQQILELLRQHPHMSAFDLAQQIGISSRKTEQNIARLKELRLLDRIGPARGGHWEVLK